MNNGVVLVGGGGHCRSVIDVLEAAKVQIAGIIHGSDCAGESVLGYSFLGRDDDLAKLNQIYSSALVTVGQVKNPAIRIRLFAILQKNGFTLQTITSPFAYVSPYATLGVGTVVMHQSLINAGTSVGYNCIINTKALIEHDCVVDNHCHIAAGVVLCGGVQVGEGTFIGANAIVHPQVTIGKNCIIGMGVRVFKDIPDGMCYRG